MENQSAKRRKTVDRDGDDRISRLPDPILLHILCFLSHKKAVQTCVLSKSWRHLGSTRPVIHLRRTCFPSYPKYTNFCEHCFGGNKKAFLSVLDNTFQTYHDQNLLLQDLRLELSVLDSRSKSALAKWIPVFVKPNTRLTTFRLSTYQNRSRWPSFYLPWVVFTAESLQNIYLYGCGIYSTTQNAVLKNLHKLSLAEVRINAETLEKIISASPLLQHVQLHRCRGLKIVSIANQNRHLNYFNFIGTDAPVMNVIEIDSPTLQSIHIERCWNFKLNWGSYFPHLKSLYLSHVQLTPTPSFDNFSCNFPLLEEFTLSFCYVGRDVKLLFSHSLKYLEIALSSSIKVDIDAPNILCFRCSGGIIPRTISLSTASREWKSYITLRFDFLHDYNDVSQRLLELHEMVKALSQSQISVTLCGSLFYKAEHIGWGFNDHVVAVEHLEINVANFFNSDSPFPYFLNDLFRVFRPRYVNALPHEAADCLWKLLIHERENKEYGWQHLKEVSIETSDGEGEVWHHVQWSCLPECAPSNDKNKIRFRLEWRD